MTDIAALAQKLQDFVGAEDVYEDGARVVSDLGVPLPLFAMLDEIDNTILERTLVFSAGATSVEMIAAGRRLRGITAATSGDGAIIGKTISRQEPDTLDMAQALLSSVFDDIDLVTVRAMPAAPFGESGERGVPAADLIEIWGVAAADETPELGGSPVARFLKMNASAFSAMLHVTDGEVIDSKGNVAALEKVWQDQASDFIEKQDALSKQSAPQKLISIDGVFENDASILMVVDGNDIALMAHDGDQLGKLHRTWKTAFG